MGHMGHKGCHMGHKGYRAVFARRNHLAAGLRLALLLVLGLSASACSLTMHLASLGDDGDNTAPIPAMPALVPRLDPSLDDEDWRRAQLALSLAIDPQGPGLPVNWDNPLSKRKGSFAAAGNMIIAQDTICRPFDATLIQPGGKQSRHSGLACRLAPGEWAPHLDNAPGAASNHGATQPLPQKAKAPLTALDNSS